MTLAAGHVDVTCNDWRLFKSWPDEGIDRMIRLLRESERRRATGEMSNAKCEEIQKACGMRYNSQGFLASDNLRAKFSLVGCATFDWVHTFLQDGCFVLEASLIVEACGEECRELIHTYLADPSWKFPAFNKTKAQ